MKSLLLPNGATERYTCEHHKTLMKRRTPNTCDAMQQAAEEMPHTLWHTMLCATIENSTTTETGSENMKHTMWYRKFIAIKHETATPETICIYIF